MASAAASTAFARALTQSGLASTNARWLHLFSQAVMALPAALAAVVYHAFGALHPLAALAWDVVVLYLTLGFRQFSHYFTDIRDALERGDDAGEGVERHGGQRQEGISIA